MPVVPTDVLRLLLLTTLNACLLDGPLDVISDCSLLLYMVVASIAWQPGGQPGSASSAAAVAAAQLQQQLGGSAGVRQQLQLMLQEVGPVVIAAHKRGRLGEALRRADEDGAVKGRHRTASMRCFGGALISLACSGKADGGFRTHKVLLTDVLVVERCYILQHVLQL